MCSYTMLGRGLSSRNAKSLPFWSLYFRDPPFLATFNISFVSYKHGFIVLNSLTHALPSPLYSSGTAQVHIPAAPLTSDWSLLSYLYK